MSSLQQVVLDQAQHATERDCHRAIEIWQQRLRELARERAKEGNWDAIRLVETQDAQHLSFVAQWLEDFGSDNIPGYGDYSAEGYEDEYMRAIIAMLRRVGHVGYTNDF